MPYILYLEEQLRLYSDLAMTRNYLWNHYLVERFPLHLASRIAVGDNEDNSKNIPMTSVFKRSPFII